MLDIGLAVAVTFSRLTSSGPPILHLFWDRELHAFGVQMNPATLQIVLVVTGSSSRL